MDFTPIDFASIVKEDIANLDLNDPYLISQCQLKPLLLNHMTRLEVKSEIMKNMVILTIMTNQSDKLFKMLKELPESTIIPISCEEPDANLIDFLSITIDDISKLDLNDPNLIDQCKIKSILPDPCMNYQEVKTELLKNIVITRISNHQYNILFERYQTISKPGKVNV